MKKLLFLWVLATLLFSSCYDKKDKERQRFLELQEKCSSGLVWIYQSAHLVADIDGVEFYYNPNTSDIANEKQVPYTRCLTGFFFSPSGGIMSSDYSFHSSVYDDFQNTLSADGERLYQNLLRKIEKAYQQAGYWDWAEKLEYERTYEQLLNELAQWKQRSFRENIHLEDQTFYVAYAMDSIINKNKNKLPKAILATDDPAFPGVPLLKHNRKLPKDAYVFPLAYQKREDAIHELAASWNEENERHDKTEKLLVIGYDGVFFSDETWKLNIAHATIKPELDEKQHLVLPDSVRWNGAPIVNQEGELVAVVQVEPDKNIGVLLTASDLNKE